MTLNIDLYEMNYSVSPGGIDCWEANVQGYGESKCFTDFKTAGEALNYVIDKYPDTRLELTVMTLKTYEKEMADA